MEGVATTRWCVAKWDFVRERCLAHARTKAVAKERGGVRGRRAGGMDACG